jgi:hypothetical protein
MLVANCDDLLRRVLTTYAIAIEKDALKNLYAYKEITESIYKKIDYDLDDQLNTMEKGRVILDEDIEHAFSDTPVSWFFGTGVREKNTVTMEYMYYRAKNIIARKAIKELSYIAKSEMNILENKKVIEDTIGYYKAIEHRAREKSEELKAKDSVRIRIMNEMFAERGLFQTEEKVLNELMHKELITPKINIMLRDELEKNTFRG